jgi:predicted dehydrogenase
MSARHSLAGLRAGIIGTGFIAPVHIEALKRLGVQVTAVCGSTDSARETAARWGIPEVYGQYDYRAMYRSPNVDVVHIASPNKVHARQLLAAIGAGKHVVCEKPMAMTSAEAARVVATIRKAGVRAPVVAVNYLCRFFPGVLQIRAMVQRGDLGQIVHVQGHVFQDWLLEDTDYNWRLHAREGGKLRVVGDIGTHWTDTVSFILGAKITSVHATLETAHKTRWRPADRIRTFARAQKAAKIPFKVDTEDIASLLLRFGRSRNRLVDGVHGNVAMSQVAAGWKCSMHIGIYGTKASVQWELQQPNEILVGRRNEPNQVMHRGGPGFLEDVADFTDYPPGHAEDFADGYKMHHRAAYQHIASGRKTTALFATAEDGYEQMRLCDAVLKSPRTKRWVAVRG